MAGQETNGDTLVLEIPSVKFAAKLGVNSKKRQLTDPVAVFENNVEPQSDQKKQEVLTTWINKVLTPPIEMDELDGDARPRLMDPKEIIAAMKKVAAGQGPPSSTVPSKEEFSLQVYVSRRCMTRLRSRASEFYLTLEPLLSRIDEVVDTRKIAIRKDKCIYSNVGLQKFLLKVLLSVRPIWLRIGLETIYGMEIGQIKNNKDVYGLTCFIMERMFNDPDLQKKYGFTSIIHYYKEEYASEMAKFFIKKFLRLFVFLDRAKTNRLIKHDPCLFYSSSECKSSEDVFAALTTEALSGDGNLFKVLAQVGYQSSYQQTYVDEARYFVQDLMKDLRDGVILCRVVELLTDDYNLTTKLRCPPISILQKVHNVGVALEVLARKGVQVKDIPAKKIVEGHREKTMTLVNRIMLRFYNIKIGDGAAQLADIFTRLQARCKGFILRRQFEKMQQEEEEESSEVDAVAPAAGSLAVPDRSISTVEMTENGKEAAFAVELPQLYTVSTTQTKGALERGENQASSMTSSCSSSVSTFSSSSHLGLIDGADASAAGDNEQRAATDLPNNAAISGFAESENSFNGNRVVIDESHDNGLAKGDNLNVDQPTDTQLPFDVAIDCTFTVAKVAAISDCTFTVVGAIEDCTFTASASGRGVDAEDLAESARKTPQASDIASTTVADQSDAVDIDVVVELGEVLGGPPDDNNQQEMAAAKIQKRWKTVVLHRRLMEAEKAAAEERARCTEAVKVIEAWWKRMLFRRRLGLLLTAAAEENVRRSKAARVIQVWWRNVLYRRQLESFVTGLLLLQAAAAEESARRSKAARVIQVWWRNVLFCRQLEMEEKAAVEEQMRQERAAKIIGQWWKRILVRRQVREAILEEQNRRKIAVAVIETWWSHILLRRRMKLGLKAAAEEYARRQTAVRAIQAWWKRMLLNHQLEIERKAAAENRAREEAAMVIGAWWKRILLRRQQERVVAAELQSRTRAVVKIQAFLKGVLVRRQVEKERLALAEDNKKKHRAAIVIQAAWRGYVFRRNPNNFPAVVQQVRQRLAAANSAAKEEQTVAVRTKNGLRYLLERESLKHISLGLQELDVVTRLSAKSCNELVEQGGVGVIFEVIHHMNHGVACQEVIGFAVSILLNIAKFEDTRKAICSVKNWFGTFVNLLRVFETGGQESVFTETAMILIILRTIDEAAPEIDGSRMALKKLRDIRALFQRREQSRQEKEKQRQLQQCGKAEMLRQNRRTQHQAPFWTVTVPRFTPDWLLTKDKPRENLSKEEAISWVAFVYKDKIE